ncbi:MAG: TonB family protein [Phenylobacterium sp.]|nr:MAG: TonB family protein [Phenylobacterium sp.]
MKTQFLLLSAAALAMSATLAHARPDTQVQAFIDRVQSQADDRLADTGVKLGDRTVNVRASVDPDGRLWGVQVTRSSGSPDADDRIARALNSLRVTPTPDQLIGANVNLVLTGARLTQTATR